MLFSYWLDNVGFISRDNLKEIMINPECGFTGFKRYNYGPPGAFCFVCFDRQTVKLNIISLPK